MERLDIWIIIISLFKFAMWVVIYAFKTGFAISVFLYSAMRYYLFGFKTTADFSHNFFFIPTLIIATIPVVIMTGQIVMRYFTGNPLWSWTDFFRSRRERKNGIIKTNEPTDNLV